MNAPCVCESCAPLLKVVRQRPAAFRNDPRGSSPEVPRSVRGLRLEPGRESDRDLGVGRNVAAEHDREDHVVRKNESSDPASSPGPPLGRPAHQRPASPAAPAAIENSAMRKRTTPIRLRRIVRTSRARRVKRSARTSLDKNPRALVRGHLIRTPVCQPPTRFGSAPARTILSPAAQWNAARNSGHVRERADHAQLVVRMRNRRRPAVACTASVCSERQTCA